MCMQTQVPGPPTGEGEEPSAAHAPSRGPVSSPGQLPLWGIEGAPG